MIKVMKLNDSATIPTKANRGDAGFDLYASENIIIPPMSRALVGTSIVLELPPMGFYGRIAPRSGLAVKNGIDVLAGVIDCGYRGEIKVVILNTDKDNPFEIKVGDRIAQLVVEACYQGPIMEGPINLTNTERSVNGFGSTGT
jgi:dUTP pyrophosphatase